MANQILGAALAKARSEELKIKVDALKKAGVNPKLVIVRFGDQAGDLAYERGILRTFSPIGIFVETRKLDENAPQSELMDVFKSLADDPSVHGILPMRPFPKWIDDELARNAIPPEKDADGVCDRSLASVFTGAQTGYAPCTAEACMALLEFEQIPLEGCRAVVVGRSLVIGKPVAMLLLQKNATVTIAHSRSKDLSNITREADILVVAAGKRSLIGAEHVRAGQAVLDVGMHFDAQGGPYGDVDYSAAEPIVSAITPARGGVGSVTTVILAGHVVDAAERNHTV
ncbi:MAG: bifunctional 5,10-methylenetetrahydrofolate dehydrogenase/5,10-methenyltetrahydrofolate cyclohydrolase [Clostridiaceae bacterium]